MMNLKAQKSQLAKLMASENILVQHKKAPTASFDVKNRVLTLPVFKDDLSVPVYDLMVSHEVGHALWTPEEGWHDAVCANGPKFKAFLNIIEDARIERKIKNKFPGLATAYRNGYAELLEKDFFGISGVDIAEMAFIDRINLHFKLGTLVGLKFEGEEAEWIEKITAAETFEEVMKISEELFAAEKEKAEEKLEEMREEANAEPEDFDDEDDSEENEPQENETDGDDEENEDMSGSSAPAPRSEEESEEPAGEPALSEESEEDYDEEFDDEDISDIPEDAEEMMGGDTDENQRENEGSLLAEESPYGDVKNYYFADKDYSKAVVDYKKVLGLYENTYSYNSPTKRLEVAEKAKMFKEDNKKIINYMVKEFEMKKKADEFKRTSISKSGELDMQKVFGYKFNDDLFKRVATVKGGKNHGFVMYIDWSGSMSRNMGSTIDQMLNLVMFCRKVKIPFEVFAFTDNVNRELAFKAPEFPSDEYLNGELVPTHFALLELFNSKMSISDFNAAIDGMIMYKMLLENKRYYQFPVDDNLRLGGTPLDSALLAAPSVIEKFQKANKVQIVNFVVLTDGDSHSCNNVKDDYIGGCYSGYRDDVYITDTVTKKTFKQTGRDMTKTLIEMVKARTGVNTVGFFVVDNKPKDIRSAFARFNIWNVDVKKFRTDKFFEVTSGGYDSYFLLPGGDDMATGSDEGLDKSLTGASKAKLRSAFMKASAAKTANRVMLGRLMERVA